MRIVRVESGTSGGDRDMRSRKLFATMTLVALLGSDFVLAASPALGQTPTQGNGYPTTPTLGGGDGAYGRYLPGPSTTAPYVGGPQQQPLQMLPQTQPQMIQRPAGPVGPNLCQPGAVTRPYQTVSIPRSRPAEPPLFQQQAPQAATVTQVTVAQNAPGAPAQATQQPGADVRTPNVGLTPSVPETEDLSRIEAGFNLDQVRVQQIGSFQQQPARQQQPLQQNQLQQQAQQSQQALLPPQQFSLSQRQSTQDQISQAYLGPYGAPLRQYGYSMFAANVSTFAPVDDIPVGPDYVLGPGDDLTINVWGAVDSTLVRTVDRNGRIVLPKVGDLRIWGLTFSQADRLIRDELARYFRGFQTSVTMGRLRTVNVYVVGEVCQPGVYTLSALSTVTNGLFSAGGPTKLGSLREVRLIRGGYQVAKLDLYDFLQRGDRTRDYRLESGDTIFVPTIGDVVAVAGEVKRPAIYEIRSDTRLADVVGLAGGLTPTSYVKRVQVVRALPSSERVTVDVDLAAYYLKVAEGERLSSVLERAGGYTDRAFLKGAVFTRASLRKIEQEQLDNFLKAQEQRILSTASTVTVGAEKEEVAAQQQAIQARREMLRLLASKVVVGRMVVHLDTSDRLKGTGDDVVLIEGDTLEVPEPPQSVLVIGSVRNSTSVQYRPGADAEYYINRVGGFAKEADKKETHIVRADGSAISSFTNIRTVEPGDSIIVPPNAEEKVRTLPTIRDVVQTIGSALLGIAALSVLGL